MTTNEPAIMQSRMTVKQAARVMNVSERSVYTARAITRLRPDLVPAIDAGTMSLAEAHRIATGKSKATAWGRLASAWNNASDDDRARLIAEAVR